jgi:hypothetical protein
MESALYGDSSQLGKQYRSSSWLDRTLLDHTARDHVDLSPVRASSHGHLMRM